MRTIARTYDTVTYESARDGDTADNGFTDSGGWHYSLLEPDVRADTEANPNLYWVPVESGDVRSAVEWARDNGCTEDNGDGSFYSVDPVHDRAFFEEGEETRYAIHFDGFSPRSLRIIAREILS